MNLLVLDEPTNDLDIETLEVLEEKLVEYQGTLIVVSHDRQFLDNVVTSTIVFEEGGKIQEYVGGYNDWLRQGHTLTETDNPIDSDNQGSKGGDDRQRSKPKKLSYKDQRELDMLPDEIAELETKLESLQTTVAAPEFYKQERDDVQATLDELSAAESLLEQRIERWSELETLRDELAG